MRVWDGVRLDTADTDDTGAMFIVNPTFFLAGELRRRPGMEGFSSTASGTAISNYYSPMTGYWAVFVTSSGTVEVQAAP